MFPIKLSHFLAVSSWMLVHLIASGGAARAHEINPAVADVTVGATQIEMVIRLPAEALLAGVDLSVYTDTNDAPQASTYDSLRGLSAEALATELREEWPRLAEGFLVTASAPVVMELVEVKTAPVGDVSLPRDTGVVLQGVLPNDGSDVTVGWVAAYGPLVVRQGEGDNTYDAFLEGGAVSAPLPRDGVADRTILEAMANYVAVGFDHIVPKGLDHILFVLGLFFFSLHLRPILMQVTAFTVAHTLTLALATLDIVTVSSAVVEPLIAATIVYVAVENVLRPKLGWWRTAIVFAFGLLHGLGFAGALGEWGLAPGHFLASLIAFNIGVELGQLFVIGCALVLIWAAARLAEGADLEADEVAAGAMPVMHRSVSMVGSLVIAIIGAWWTVERVFF